MIRPTKNIKVKIKLTGSITGKLNGSTIVVEPELEKLNVIASVEKQIYKPEKYGFEEVTVQGVTAEIDEDIKAENIKSGVNILGVDGSYEGVDTSDATATAGDILHSKTAYINNKKITGIIQEYDGSYTGNTSSGNELKITDARYLFYQGARVDYYDTFLGLCHSIISSRSMFAECKTLENIDLSNLDTSNVTDMTNMFYSCSAQQLNLSGKFKTSNVTNMQGMFYQAQSIKELDLSNFETSKVENMTQTFYSMSNLVSLNLSSFDMSKVTMVSSMFYNSKKLANLSSFKNYGKGFTFARENYNSYALSLSSCTKLTNESLIDVLTNGLYDLNLTYDVANGGTLYRQSVVLGSTNLAKLTATEEGQQALAEADRKGWNVT